MNKTDHPSPELSELYGLVLSSQAATRARFNAILQIQARILARLEGRDETEILEELKALSEREREAESEELKEYLKRPKPKTE